MPKINLSRKKRKNVPTVVKGQYQEIYQDRRWKSLQAWKKRKNPLCEICRIFGVATPTDEIHHTIPFHLGRNLEEVEMLAFDPELLMSVCTKHHKTEHKKLAAQNTASLVDAYFTRSYR